jgi:hypothetical protein
MYTNEFLIQLNPIIHSKKHSRTNANGAGARGHAASLSSRCSHQMMHGSLG